MQTLRGDKQSMNLSTKLAKTQYPIIIFILLVLLLSACGKYLPAATLEPDRPTATDNSIIVRPEPTSTRPVPTNTSTVQAQSSPIITIDNVDKLELVTQVTEPTINSFAWLGRGQVVSLAMDTHIVPYTRFPLEPIEGLSTPYNYPAKLTVSVDGEKMAWIDEENIIYIWEPDLVCEVIELTASDAPFTSLAFSPTGRDLAIASHDGSVEIWNTADQELVNTWQFPTWYSNLAFSPEGEDLAAVDTENFKIDFINVDDGKIQRSLEWTEHASPVLNGAIFSPDWNTIGWVARGTVQLMDQISGDLGLAFQHEDAVNSLSWSPDSTLLATASAGTILGAFSPVVYVWDIDSGRKVNELVQPAVVTQIVFSPNGTEIGALIFEDGLLFWAVAK